MLSILMSRLHNERDREMRWLIEKDNGGRNYGFNSVSSFFSLNLKSFFKMNATLIENEMSMLFELGFHYNINIKLNKSLTDKSKLMREKYIFG
jgi:hypothetical protein